MATTQPTEVPVTVDVENVGGIDRTQVTLRPGVNVLTGRNATNRTSFLQAIKAAIGSDEVTLKGDADEGGVELALGDETFSRTLRRSADSVVTDGDPYLDDPTLADLFAFLLEDNEVRRAVARGADLRELVMRPVDTDAIREEIERLETEKRRADDRLEELASVEDRLEDLRSRREELEREREEKRDELAEKEAELDDADTDVEASREEKAEFEGRMDDLKEARSRLEDVRFKLESNRESLASVREERESVEATLDDLDQVESGSAAELDERIEELREEKRRLDSQVNRLQNLVRLNQELLDGDDELLAELHSDHDHDDSAVADRDGPVTDQLLADEEGAVCWTCGSEVAWGEIEATVERLRELNREKSEERRRLVDEIDDLSSERSAIRERRQRREDLDRRLDRLDDEIEEREATVERLREEREELTDEIETLETEVEELGTDDYGAVLDLHREANRLEFEIDRLSDEIEATAADIGEAERELDARAELEEEREELTERLADLRTRIEDIERGAVEQFNERMAELLDLLEYENLERLWVERVEREVREGRRKVSRTAFELHVVRTTVSGTAYEDTVAHLSESEREVTGLVFALAGYLVHDVHETVPFVLLDSLEAIDAERIATLVEYFSDYAPYLVVALLPEDAAALDEGYHRVTEI